MRHAHIAVLLALLTALSAAQPVVTTPYGMISGAMDNGGYAFRGIPYAAPPVGELRFASPQEPAAWSGTLNGTTFGAGCMASCSPLAFPKPSIMCTPVTSEDCLFLNVYTPTLNTSANLPVVMFMHGGNYVGGSGGVPLYDGGYLAMRQNIVVVTINYRLGLIGGLYTGTVLGNFQTQDQRQSMKWIKKCISAFGGNPSLLTITGQSAGAFSVAVHLSSPKSWPYFQRAIIVSDPFSLPAANPEHAIKLGEKVLEKLGCPRGGDAELSCLRAVNASTLQDLSEHTDYTPWPNQIMGVMMQWVPVVDGNDLPYQPLQAMLQGNITRVPVLFGTVANESVQFIYDISPKPLARLEYDILLDMIFGFSGAAKVKAEYGPLPPKDYNDAREFVSVIATDYIFYCVNHHIGAALTQVTDTFMYMFDKVGTWNEWVFGAVMPWCVDVVCHASDLPFIFNPFAAPTMPKEAHPLPTAAEYKLIDYLQTVWGNFAYNGNPNVGRNLPHANGVSWPNFNGTSNVLVNLSTPVGYLNGYRNQQCEFWDTMGYYRW